MIDKKIERAVQQSVKSARLPLDTKSFADTVAKKVSSALPSRQECIVPGLEELVDKNLGGIYEAAADLRKCGRSMVEAAQAVQRAASKSLGVELKLEDLRTILDHLVKQ